MKKGRLCSMTKIKKGLLSGIDRLSCLPFFYSYFTAAEGMVRTQIVRTKKASEGMGKSRNGIFVCSGTEQNEKTKLWSSCKTRLQKFRINERFY